MRGNYMKLWLEGADAEPPLV